jgi:hypothetical protein
LWGIIVGSRVVTWKSAFGLFRKKLRVVETLTAWGLKEGKMERSRRMTELVVFPSLSNKPDKPGPSCEGFAISQEVRWCGKVIVYGFSYSGPKMSEALDMLVGSVEYLI